VWALWSAKESAYKIINKCTGIRSYVPLSFEVKLNDVLMKPYIERQNANVEMKNNPGGTNLLEGTVSTPYLKAYIKILLTQQCIYCTACSDNYDLESAKWKVINDPSVSDAHQSHAIREAAKNHIARSEGLNPEDIGIIREQVQGQPGPPLVYINNKKDKNIDLTLTHDGSYSAYAFIKQQSKFS